MNTDSFRKKLHKRISKNLTLSYAGEGKRFSVDFDRTKTSSFDAVNGIVQEVIDISEINKSSKKERKKYATLLAYDLCLEFKDLIRVLPGNLKSNRVVVTCILINFPEDTEYQEVLSACRKVNSFMGFK